MTSTFQAEGVSLVPAHILPLYVVHPLAQLSVLSFDRIRLNEPVEAGAFTLDYPEGVDIIRDGA